MTGAETEAAVLADGDQAPDYYKVLSVQVSAEALKVVPAWAYPGPPDTRGMDGYHIATGLLYAAYGAHLGDTGLETQEWLHQATAARIMEHGRCARLRAEKLTAYVGAPLFAGRLSAEVIRRTCLKYAPDDQVLHDAVDDVIGLLWPTRATSRPPGQGSGGVMKGLALLRHVQRLGYGELHPGLELLGKAAAKDDHLYPRVLRNLNRVVAERHMRYADRREDLYEALLYLLPAEGRPKGAGRPAALR